MTIPDTDSQVTSSSLQATITQTITSPLPLASEMRGYEQILQGSANRILIMVENQSKHRMEIERRSLEI